MKIEGCIVKYDSKFYDGYSINKDALKGSIGKKVPFVWSEYYKSVDDNILGDAILEEREDGIYAVIEFNNTKNAQCAYDLCKDGSVISLYAVAYDILFANRTMMKGDITKVSCLLKGCLPGTQNKPFMSVGPVGEHYVAIYACDKIKVVKE